MAIRTILWVYTVFWLIHLVGVADATSMALV